MIRRRRHPAGCAAFLATLLCASPLAAQQHEAATARHFDAIRDQTPAATAFLRAMPKGGDLHSHLSGAIYAESYLRWAAEQGLCLTTEPRPAVVRPPCDSAAGKVAAARAERDEALRARFVDGVSMRNWQPAQRSGHEQFFGAFSRFGPATNQLGAMLAEVTARAAAGRVRYLELMHTPDEGAAARLGRQVGWHGDVARTRELLLASGLREVAAEARRTLDSALVTQRRLLRCDSASADPGCAVEVRFLYQVSRNRAPENVFAQILLGFELAVLDRRVVGLNLVQAEDYVLAMRDYSLHMRMIGELRPVYPDVSVTLHAGELAPGLVPPEALRFHIREAVEVAGAERIGHGVDVAHEDGAEALLARMAERGVLVEIALGSNAAILGVSGRDHPLSLYLARGVPVTLVTDDEGVLRSELSLEYLRAAQEHGLGYLQLKRMVRNSLEHAFADPDTKRRLLAELERAFERFEVQYAESGR